MADEATQEVEETSTAEETAAESQSDEQTQDAGTQESAEQASDKADDASTGDKSKVETQDPKPESKPLSRRSAAYRIQQLTRENKQLKEQQKPAQQNEWDEETQTDDKPDIQALIDQAVEKRLHPIVSESTKAADDSEINELFSGDRAGERPKYEPAIREMWKLPQYKDVAASELYKIASFDDAVSTATQKAIEEYKKAEKEAKESSASGTSNSNRNGKGGKSINDLPDDEFLKRNERIKAGLPV
jgi:hypothetical protein